MMVCELSLQLDVDGRLALAIAVQVHDVPVYILLSYDKKAIGWERCQESFPTFAWWVAHTAPCSHAQ